ncbi:MAG: RNA methyltransferase, partial [Candidatus Eremiobacteraeota bacterium]|nr:RNA methyltransferase [Candidatus Eremiobacteraeota bacterium]
MPLWIGGHSERIARVRDLLTTKGRREQGRFAFEGPTLLDEAIASKAELLEIYATERAFASNPALGQLDALGTGVFLMDERVAAKISDLETPTGLVTVATMRYAPLRDILEGRLTLILADLNDPGNAGTLMRSAEAFGASGAVFGRFGVDPYHPKVVRGSMGAIFRLPVAVANPDDLVPEFAGRGLRVIGLSAAGEPLAPAAFAGTSALVVGHERHGLGTWEALCT